MGVTRVNPLDLKQFIAYIVTLEKEVLMSEPTTDLAVTLPEPQVAESHDPQKLLFISHHKTGKTTLAAALPNSLIIDTENGTGFVDGTIFNLQKELVGKPWGPVTMLQMLSDEIRRKNTEHGAPVFDFIAIDTVTGLEGVARKYATYMYKNSGPGKNFKGTDVVSELPQGGGYDWLRRAFVELYKLFEGLSSKGLILLGHTKYSSIVKTGKELQAKDVDLTGKLKQIVCRDMDAIGYLYRKGNQVVASFISHEQDLTVGARPPHLRNKEIVVSELGDNGEFTFYWNDIYKSLN